MPYFDYNAAAPGHPKTDEGFRSAPFGNPASVHAAGRAAGRVLEQARRHLGRHLQVTNDQVAFVSGATEANVWVVHNTAADEIWMSAAEHDSLRVSAGEKLRLLPLTGDGLLDLAVLQQSLHQAEGRILLCVSAASGETGVIQPLAAVAELCRDYNNVHLHIDAVQAFGRLPAKAYVGYGDTMSVGFHKAGGCRGLAALIAKNFPAPLITGGGQERGRRSGTPNVPAAAALAAWLDDEFEHLITSEAVRLRQLHDLLESDLIAAGWQIIGIKAPRLPNTTYAAHPRLEAAEAVIAADLAGLYLSAGSACSSGKAAVSPIPEAIGRPDLRGRALRLSSGHASSPQDFAEAGRILKTLGID